jgi:hypothetical protein
MRLLTVFTFFPNFSLVILTAALASGASAQEDQRSSVTWSGFIKDQISIEGDGWAISKYQLDDYTWRARLTSGDKLVREYADCGDFEQWMRYYVWKSEEHGRELLMICRFSGKNDKCCYWLDVIDPSDDFKTLFQGEVDKGLTVEDVNGDGWPELITSSRQFDYFDFAIRFSYVQAPYAPLIFAYDSDAAKYRVATPAFPESVMPRLETLEASYRESFGAEKIPATLATVNHRKIPTNFRTLVNLVVGLCYAGQEERAFAFLEEFTDPALYAFTKHAIRRELKKDPKYTEVRMLQIRLGLD